MSSKVRIREAANSMWGVIAALGTIGAVSSAARADVTIVSQETQGAGAARTETTYYKGHKIRGEGGKEGRVTIYDGDAGKLYILNPLQKTYFPLDPSSVSASPMMAMVKVTSIVKVTPTGATRKIAGQAAREYKFAANIDMAMDPKMMAAMSGGAPAGKAANTAPKHIGAIRVDGDEWVARIASLPGGGSGTVKASMQQMTTVLPDAKATLEKLGSIPGVPLAETLTMTFETTFGPKAGNKRLIKHTTTAMSVREGALADSLFTIPAGYKLQQGGMMGMPPGGAPRPGVPTGGVAMPR